MSTNPKENPFEDPIIAQQWIQSRESSGDLIYLNELAPLLRTWGQITPMTILVDIGSGQGITSELFAESLQYIGIEPSAPLIIRAQERYAGKNRQWLIGNASDIPLPDNSADATLSVNVWFHLASLAKPAQEMARILKPNGHFLISTVNPRAYSLWRSLYTNVQQEGMRFEGAVATPHTPLSRNVVYTHTLDDMLQPLQHNHLTIDHIHEYGYLKELQPLFILIYGRKL